MKKNSILVLLLLTVLFLGFICGFFIGRNLSHGDVQISHLPRQTTAPIHTDSPVNAVDPVPSHPTHGKININTATIDQLVSLPGIGEVLAQNIIDYRNNNGNFKKVADLLLVEGIGEQRLDSIIDLITV